MVELTMKILFVAPLSPPITGQSLACDSLVRSLRKRADIQIVNLSKPTFRQGVNSVGRVFDVMRIIFSIYRARNKFTVLYLTVSESFAGNLKDLLIYVVCWSHLDKIVIHLHGGAGMREIMGKEYSLIRALNSFFLRRLGAVVVLGGRLKGIYEGVVPATRLYVVPNFANDEFSIFTCKGLNIATGLFHSANPCHFAGKCVIKAGRARGVKYWGSCLEFQKEIEHFLKQIIVSGIFFLFFYVHKSSKQIS